MTDQQLSNCKGNELVPSDISTFPPEYFCWRFTQTLQTAATLKNGKGLQQPRRVRTVIKNYKHLITELDPARGSPCPREEQLVQICWGIWAESVGALGAVKGTHMNRTLQRSRKKRAALRFLFHHCTKTLGCSKGLCDSTCHWPSPVFQQGFSVLFLRS